MRKKRVMKAKKVKEPNKQFQVKKEKSEAYIIKKNTAMRVIRVMLWAMLIFFFVKGILITFKPDDSAEVTQMIEDFRTEFKGYKDSNEEILGFAQNFAKEYLTYEAKGENDYKSRIEPYVTNKVYNLTDITDMKNNAKATYTNAYRKEEYNENQYDVYVKAEVEYSIEETVETTEDQEGLSAPSAQSNENVEDSGSLVEEETEESNEEIIIDNNSISTVTDDSEIDTSAVAATVLGQQAGGTKTVIKKITKDTTLKIPIRKIDNKYIVEDLPVFITDDMKEENVDTDEYSGQSIDDATIGKVKESLINFMKAYYEQDQSVIEYYLSKDADKEKYLSLEGRYHFVQIESLKCYQEEGQENVLCIVKYSITDSVNGAAFLQELNILMKPEGDKYYVQDMNTKIGNLKTN